MKKIIFLLAFLVLTTGCANQPSESADPSDSSVPAATPANTICQKLPLSPNLGPGGRFYCLAVVNQDPHSCLEIKGDVEDMQGEEKNPKEAPVNQESNKTPGIIDDGIKGNDRGGNEEAERNLCLAHANRDPSFCQKLPDPAAKKVCYNVLAQISQDIDICAGIDYSRHEEQQCYFNYVNALYWENKSNLITAEDCDKVGLYNSNPDRNTCLAFQARDASLCGKNLNCLTFFEQEMSFCTSRAPKGCVRDRAMTNKDLSLCEQVPPAEKDGCFSGFAVHLEPDTKICDQIPDLEKRQGCYIDVAIALAKK